MCYLLESMRAHRSLSARPGGRGRNGPSSCGRALALAVLALGAGCSGDAEEAPALPGLPANAPIVIVVVDTLRADGLGLYGYERATSTPLDEWAARGAVFEHAFSTAPWTLPSVASLFTGRYPASHGSGRREVALPEGGTKDEYVKVDDSAPRLAGLLAQRGYATAAFVTNAFLRPGFGLAQGFELYDYGRNKDRDARAADVMVDRALAWIDERAPDQPWFLVLHLLDPHLPYAPPADVAGRFTQGYEGSLVAPIAADAELVGEGRRGELALADADRDFLRGLYDEEVAFVSAQVARFLDGLEARAVLANGLVLVTADHGEEFLDHGTLEHGHTLYQELLRIPFVFWGHGVQPGRRRAPVSLVDVVPTILEATGLARGAGLEGVSLWPALTAAGTLAPRALFAENSLYGEPRRARIEWPYKLIASGEPPRFELYDLERDPRERTDLSATHPEVTTRLAAGLAQRARSTRPREAMEVDEELRNDLHEIGYTGE